VHVLCEKPMAPTERECNAMIDACADAGVHLMIGYRLHFEAANLAAIDLATDGRLGEPRYFSSTFSLQVREGNIRVQDRPGAGPHWDLGIYCINAARYLFRAEPYEVTAMAFHHHGDERFRAVPEQVSAVLRFPGDRVASFVCSFGAYDRAHYTLGCTDGVVTLDNAYEYQGEMELTVLRGDGHRTKTFSKKDQIAAEIDYFARCVRDGRVPEPSGYEGLADVRVLRAIERSIESGRTEGIEPIERVRRPEPRQELWIKPHGKPRTVDVESGSR
jgi:predicted dehydrogenase